MKARLLLIDESGETTRTVYTGPFLPARIDDRLAVVQPDDGTSDHDWLTRESA